MSKLINDSTKMETRRELRRRSTPAEKIFWNTIRSRSLHGLKFRRQVSIGSYIVDFYLPSHKLVIELDGDSHYKIGAQAYDERRSAFLQQQGFRVLRFTNTEIRESLEGVVEKILEAVNTSGTPPPAPPQ